MKAILVTGGESTGTRLMTKILISMGYYGDSGHEQRLDQVIPQYPAIVWRRSVPHARQFPPLAQMATTLRGLGYEVSALVMMRDWHCAAKSQVQAGHVANMEEAECNLRKAYAHITEQLRDVPFTMVSYESLVQRPANVVWQALGLPEVNDENGKYYE
jgi:hypothetical protein